MFSLVVVVGLLASGELLALLISATEAPAPEGLALGHQPGQPFLRYDPGAGGWVRARQELLPHTFVPETVPEDTLRVAVLGGSTVATLPPAGPAFQLAALLEAGLERPLSLTIGGGAGFGSTRVAGLFTELLEHGLDWAVLYTGHNEFAEARHNSLWLDARPGLGPSLRRWLSRSHLLGWIRMAIEPRQQQPRRFVAPGGPLADGEAAVLRARFETNLDHIARSAAAAGTRSLWVLPASNPAHPPILSSPLDPALERALAAANQEVQTLQEHRGARSTGATQALVEAAPDHARAWWLLGQVRWVEGDLDGTAAAWARARDLDASPLRATTSLRETMAEVARRHNIPVVDAEAVLRRHSPRAWLEGKRATDPMHLDPFGYRLVVEAIYDTLAAEQTGLRPRSWLRLPTGEDGAYPPPRDLLVERGPSLATDPRSVRHPGPRR